jgi:CTP:molybdopterin cytidylyltransferase MocA
MGIPAVVAAGDRGAAKTVHGQSKVFLELGGRPMVAWVVACLQRVPEVSEVWVVGDAEQLGSVFARPDLAAELVKPLHVVPQFQNLYENLWESYRRLLPEAGSEGRDPAPEDADTRVLYLSGDLPFATPQEISQFVQRSLESGAEYALGLVTEQSMAGFQSGAPDEPGIQMASFNLREGRYRQSNLHLVTPARLRNRRLIEDMYENRHQRELGPVVAMAFRLLRRGGVATLWYFLLMHLAGLADRRGWRGTADLIRAWVPLARVARGCGELLGTRFEFVSTDVGGCAIDVDTEPDYDASVARFEEWRRQQAERAERCVGPLPLPASAE